MPGGHRTRQIRSEQPGYDCEYAYGKSSSAPSVRRTILRRDSHDGHAIHNRREMSQDRGYYRPEKTQALGRTSRACWSPARGEMKNGCRWRRQEPILLPAASSVPSYSYRVVSTCSAERELKKLPPQVIGRILSPVQNLSLTPRPAGYEKLQGDREWAFACATIGWLHNR